MLTRALATFAVLALTSLSAAAAEFKAFSAEAFDAARKAGKGVIVHVHAPWCPTCRAQAPILDKLASDPAFKDVVALRIDFDSQKDGLKAVSAQNQSTVVVYRGDAETGRAVGATDAKALEEVARKAL